MVGSSKPSFDEFYYHYVEKDLNTMTYKVSLFGSKEKRSLMDTEKSTLLATLKYFYDSTKNEEPLDLKTEWQRFRNKWKASKRKHWTFKTPPKEWQSAFFSLGFITKLNLYFDCYDDKRGDCSEGRLFLHRNAVQMLKF
tara:strand:+ start:4597 stop:5013 length:417 start_codon:yes stop_codon:yes gene_type:complete